MSRPSYLLSDLHLPTGPSPLRETFRKFLQGLAREAGVVYILGDLFEYWIGDDAGLQDYAEEVQALSALTASGVPVYFQHGNRDFLVGKTFCARTGVQLLPDPHCLDLAGKPALLAHGDLFCTADVSYQHWRRFSRNRVIQGIYLALPLFLRRRIAGSVRSQSDSQKQYKPGDIMDVSAAAIRAAFERHGTSLLIHGHTHRPAEHNYDIESQKCQRIVLADWRHDRCEALRVDADGIQRLTLSA